MGSGLRYWKLVIIAADGKPKEQEIPALETFWRQQFPEFVNAADVPDRLIQRQLCQALRADATFHQNQPFAEFCLRCFISHQIEQTCWQLEEQFRTLHGIQAIDLFPFVLNDLIPLAALRPLDLPASSYRSLATEILQTFNPDQSSLSTWTKRLVRSHPDLKAFLMEHGVYLISDWALLNDTTLAQAQRILMEFHQLSEIEIDQATQLLDSYHAVYRRDRLQQRQAGGRGICADPTADQLRQIAHQFSSATGRPCSPEQAKQALQMLAQRLRDYRIAVRSKKLPTRSLDQDGHSLSIQDRSASDEESDPAVEFLRVYRQELENCLDQAIAEVINLRLNSHQRKIPPTDQQFLRALHLFHCEGKPMSSIAAQIGLHEQYRVTRLLNLKSLRADVRQVWLLKLRDRVRMLAQSYVDPTRLQQVDQLLNTILDEQITDVMAAAEKEASVANRARNSQFARRLCSDLDRRGIAER